MKWYLPLIINGITIYHQTKLEIKLIFCLFISTCLKSWKKPIKQKKCSAFCPVMMKCMRVFGDGDSGVAGQFWFG